LQRKLSTHSLFETYQKDTKLCCLVTNQKVPTPQAIGTWLRRLGKDNQVLNNIKAFKPLLS
jgi:hypothetical protein